MWLTWELFLNILGKRKVYHFNLCHFCYLNSLGFNFLPDLLSGLNYAHTTWFMYICCQWQEVYMSMFVYIYIYNIYVYIYVHVYMNRDPIFFIIFPAMNYFSTVLSKIDGITLWQWLSIYFFPFWWIEVWNQGPVLLR
jgi:hypothetical protein